MKKFIISSLMAMMAVSYGYAQDDDVPEEVESMKPQEEMIQSAPEQPETNFESEGELEVEMQSQQEADEVDSDDLEEISDEKESDNGDKKDREWKDGDKKDRSWRDDHHKRSHRHKYRDRNGIGFQVGIFADFIPLVPARRVEFFYSHPRTTIFVEKVRLVDPDCLFEEEGIYTIFVPEDEYIRSEGVWDTRDSQQICEVMKHYVVAEPIIFSEQMGEEPFTVEALDGTELTISKKNGEYYVNGIRIIKTNTAAKGGMVFHVIEGNY